MYASHDMLGLVAMVQRKIFSIGGRLARQGGGVLDLPKGNADAMIRARRVHQRFERGDFKITDQDVGCVVETANYLAAKHAELDGHPIKSIDWNLRSLQTELSPPPEAFEEAVAKAIMEW